MSTPIKNRYDFVLIFDVQDGNPNGDPDAGNLPRVDSETGSGLVTDVCLKRKVRNFVQMTKSSDQDDAFRDALDGERNRYEIYVKERAVLNRQHARAYTAIGADDLLQGDKKKRKGGDRVDDARQWMCRNFFDIRTFGAVMSTGVNCGQVRGPVQMTFGRSVDPIVGLEHCITRVAVTTEEKAKEQEGDNREMGRKNTVPYGLYVSHGFVSAHLAQQTGFSEEDLALFWRALVEMFEHDRSAARGLMATRKLMVFKHKDPLGNAPAHRLFDLVHIARTDRSKPARAFSDYTVSVGDAPAGVERIEMA